VAEAVPLEQASIEHDGRVYTGVGVDEAAIEAALAQTSKGQQAADDQRAEPAPVPDGTARDAKGQFTAPDESRPTRGQRRFTQLTSERDKERARADAAEARAKELEARLNGQSPTAPQPPAAPAPVETPPPLAAAKPTLEQFANEPDPLAAYLEALAAWTYEQKAPSTVDARLEQRLEAERASRALQQSVAESWERGQATYPDFKAVIARSTVQLPNAILAAIARAPGSEHIQYALASDDALAQRIGAITDPVELGLTLGRLGSGPASVRSASPARPATTQAPPPIQPVSGASRTANPSPEELATAGRYEDYKARRHSDMGVRIR